MRLKDRNAIVTGAGGGMGLGISQCLTREGAAIVATDIDGGRAQATADQLGSEGATAIAIAADITDESACRDLVSQAIERFGAIDILVNNAGHFGTIVGAPFTNFTGEEWDSNYDIHVKGPFFLCKAIAPHMIERRYGRIVNISSAAARRDPTFLPTYAAAKNAMLSLTRLTAKDLGPHNITVNAVLPGFVWTNFWHTLAPKLAEVDPAYAGKTPRAGVRPVHRQLDADAARADARGHRQHGRLPRLGRGAQRHRPDHKRQRRHGIGLKARLSPAAAGVWRSSNDRGHVPGPGMHQPAALPEDRSQTGADIGRGSEVVPHQVGDLIGAGVEPGSFRILRPAQTAGKDGVVGHRRL